MSDELERLVREGKRRRVGPLERDPAAQLVRHPPARVVEHRFRQIDADDLRRGKAAGDRDRPRAGAGAEIERALRCGRKRVEARLVRCERVFHAHRLPHGRQRVELPAQERPEEPPHAWTPHRRIRREPRELAADRDADHDGSRWMRTSCPALIPSIAAAFPPLIAMDRLRYESSYRIRSPGRASANVRAATA